MTELVDLTTVVVLASNNVSVSLIQSYLRIGWVKGLFSGDVLNGDSIKKGDNGALSPHIGVLLMQVPFLLAYPLGGGRKLPQNVNVQKELLQV